MTLKPGTVADFADSMAKAMEEAFEVEWQAVKGVALPEEGRQDRRLLMAAIAQGVVRHFRDHAEEAFQIAVETTQTGANVTSSGHVTGTSNVDVTQDSGTTNRVTSEGTATVTAVDTEGLHP
ncbi:hypothetical protein [Halomonas cerina]|uniref:Uncharacterized protein n=1 Tax=Halomonas cerina TaxID=447424 RepID=A0A839VCM2_9GAMM|nr:hypothetical protein [Halomonas cerina]MBB3191868.1 hypothetical protein [Halomonas cerina]